MEKDKRTTLKRRTAGVLKKNSVQINTEFCNADKWCPINLYKSGLFFVIERELCVSFFRFLIMFYAEISFYAELNFTICLLISQGF